MSRAARPKRPKRPERAASGKRAAGGKRAARRTPARAARQGTRPAALAGRLWAPWRMAWLRHADAPAGCLFCRVSAASADRRDLVLARTPHALLMLNRYPYTSAHLMVAVRRHAARFRDLTAAERDELHALTALAERALEAEYAPDGVNYGLNVGKVAGAGFPGHLHLHMVPRWSGDTNFMPAIAEVRVLPESLAATWSRLKRAIAVLPPESPRARAPRGGGARGAARR